MQKAARLSKIGFWSFALAAALAVCVPGVSAEEIKKLETGQYRDVFLQNMYYEATNYLRLDRLYRALSGKKLTAQDINEYDEVPDSAFFTNRHGRTRLSAEALAKGPSENSGPDLSKPLTVLRGKYQGTTPGFFVRDAQGDEYLLKFDSVEAFEASTAGEAIASRTMHAIGYNVPQYSVAHFTLEQIEVDPDATIYDDSGFKKQLTRDRFEKYMMFMPQDDQGRYRASAGKILKGINKGFTPFQGRRKDDPQDKMDHERRRSMRALRVFASWLNFFDIREGNTLDMLVDENGTQTLKHYLIDFNDAFGAARGGVKPPHFTYENLVDYQDATKAYFSLGLWEKAWQKKWRESGEAPTQEPGVGYWDNRYLKFETYKSQLPSYMFKDLTNADGFWAAKIIHSFTDEDIRTLMKTGQYSNPEDEELNSKILIERRDLLVHYWFSKVNPLDDFSFQNGALSFSNLAVDAGLDTPETILYGVEVRTVSGSKSKHLAQFEAKESPLDLSSWTSSHPDLDVVIRKGTHKKSPWVLVKIRGGKLASVRHQD